MNHGSREWTDRLWNGATLRVSSPMRQRFVPCETTATMTKRDGKKKPRTLPGLPMPALTPSF